MADTFTYCTSAELPVPAYVNPADYCAVRGLEPWTSGFAPHAASLLHHANRDPIAMLPATADMDFVTPDSPP